MLRPRIAHTPHRPDPRHTVHVAGASTEQRTAHYLRRLWGSPHLESVVRFDGAVADMPAWYADKGVLLSTSMYESFGLNIGEAMAMGAFPVVHDSPGVDVLWSKECPFASIDEAVALIRSARTRLHRDWVRDRYGLERQVEAVPRLLGRTAMIRVIAVGRARDEPEAELFARYAARVRPVLALSEIADGKGAPAEIKRREAEALMATVPSDAFAIALDQDGAMLDTETFAARLEGWLMLSRPICFLIGGAEGLDRPVLERVDFTLSLGRLTWPHLLARAMLAEQIYRARSIAAGHPYHRRGRPA
jgi:23S rRNA (pseudouridine1915-N3)-methyltransferase